MDIFIIGNGKSRLSFDINELQESGLIIGCNYAFRNFKCDSISIVDPKPMDAFLNAQLPEVDLITAIDSDRLILWNNIIIGNMPNHLIDCDEKHWEAWDSGRLALIAGIIKYKPSRVFLLGFDFLDAHDPKKHHQHQDSNNIYHNRHIQRPDNTERIYNYVVDEYPEIEFYHVGHEKLVELMPLKNGTRAEKPKIDPIIALLKMRTITYEDFSKLI